MAEQLAPVKINAAFIVKDEWPLLALSVSHALFHYAEKVIIIDTGSHDGTFQGIKILQSIWGDRIELYRCNQEIYDQTPLTNLLLELSKNSQCEWTMVLDADEFFIHDNYVDFLSKLSQTEENWLAYAIDVINFIVNEGHNELELKAYGEISYRVVGQSKVTCTDTEYIEKVLSGVYPLQLRITPQKILARNSNHIFLSQGNHQVVFGDGVWWEKFDSKVASAANLGGKIYHLPYTSERRIRNRKERSFFDQQKTTARLNWPELQKQSTSDLLLKAVVGDQNRDEWLESNLIIEDDSFNRALRPVIEKIREIWPDLIDAVYSTSTQETFPDALDLRIVSKLIRKYHDRAEKLWPGISL